MTYIQQSQHILQLTGSLVVNWSSVYSAMLTECTCLLKISNSQRHHSLSLCNVRIQQTQQILELMARFVVKDSVCYKLITKYSSLIRICLPNPPVFSIKKNYSGTTHTHIYCKSADLANPTLYAVQCLISICLPNTQVFEKK